MHETVWEIFIRRYRQTADLLYGFTPPLYNFTYNDPKHRSTQGVQTWL
jgi:hypothetical protein